MPDEADRTGLLDTDAEREKKQQAEEQRTHDQQSDQYRTRQLWFNGILACASIITFVALSYQNFLLRKTLTEVREQSGAMKDTLSETKVQTSEFRVQTDYAQANSEAAVQSAAAAIEAVKVARENFERDQRPYLWLTETSGPIYKEFGGGRIVWNCHFTNYGKTPAQIIGGDVRMNIGENALKSARLLTTNKPGTRHPVPPGKDDFFTTISPEPVSRTQFAELLQRSESIIVYGQIVYTDSTQAHYDTTFCLYNLASGVSI